MLQRGSFGNGPVACLPQYITVGLLSWWNKLNQLLEWCLCLCNDKNKWRAQKRVEKEMIFCETMHVCSNRGWHSYSGGRRLQTAELLIVFMKDAAAVFTHSSGFVLMYFRIRSWYVCFASVCFFFPFTLRFADSIRGMLKLILVLMLAGASLASTWFTLTCLSTVTHLPSTAGGSTAAASLSRSLCKQTEQLEPELIQEADQSLVRHTVDRTMNYSVDMLKTRQVCFLHYVMQLSSYNV